MSKYPHTKLYLRPEKSIVISGPHIQVLDNQTGDVVHSTTTLEGSEKDAFSKSGPVRCSAMDQTGSHLVTAGDDKKMKVWQVDGLKLLSERELPKRPTQIHFTRDGQTILVSDKFGDIFSYTLTPEAASTSTSHLPTAGASKRGSLTSHENPSNGTLILGHTSLLTSFLLTEDEKFIVSADRDEHIRVSWYPQGYVIERYCLGHKKFVSAIHIPSFSPSLLISGGGDPKLRVWEWLSGKQIGSIPVLQTVEPYIKAKVPKGRRPGEDGEDGAEGHAKPGRKRLKVMKAKGKGKGKQEESSKAEESGETGTPNPEGEAEKSEDVKMEDESAPANVEASTSEQQPKDTEPEKPVLVLHKLETMDLGEQNRQIVFSAVGATALFYIAYPASFEPGTVHSVHALDFRKPVLDFTVGQDDKIWVLLDSEWQESPTLDAEVPSSSTDSSPVRIASWQEDKLVDITDTETPHNPLLRTLTTSTIPATPTDLKTLDLYGHLASMPKAVDPEHDPMIKDDLSELASTEAGKEGKALTQRELGRLKNKKALLAKIQEKQKKQGGDAVAGGQAEVEAEAEGEGEGEEREVKKPKADSESVNAAPAMDES
ncbi:WD40 repeat-like protein [Panus rudis PR-1116 ss-1]|nr:WD40 repeat-like protein [Panus rudis PR-1116 ss-1]